MSDEGFQALAGMRQALGRELGKCIKGQAEAIDLIFIALVSNGHVMIEGVPGLGKSLMAQALGLIIEAEQKRIQFTPDLMPSDIVGTSVYDAQSQAFRVKRGPVFTNILLADEINRAPAKTQSALLEAMQERKVSIDGVDYALPDPFLVLATQNPVEMEGTYPLPEAQLDRFMLQVKMGYPERQAELDMLRAHRDGFEPARLGDLGLEKVADAQLIGRVRQELAKVKAEDTVIDYLYRLIAASRSHKDLALGVSPRGAIDLFKASRANAALDGRDYIVPEDIRSMLVPVARHRSIIKPEAELEGRSGEEVLAEILASVEVPRS